MYGLDSFFTTRDWAILAGYLAVVGLITGWLHRRRRGDAGAKVAWPLVAASLAASELGGWLFLAVPGVVLAIHGDLVYLQWILVSLAVRLLVGMLLIRRGWSLRKGSGSGADGVPEGMRRLFSFLTHLANFLTQALRLLVLSIPLVLITGWRVESCLLAVLVVGLLLRATTGGIGAVVRMEGLHLAALAGVAVSLVVLLAESTGAGWEVAIGQLRESADFDGKMKDKLAFLDPRTDPVLSFTVWTALFCLPWFQFHALTLDRANLLRLRLCETSRGAGAAVIASGVLVVGFLALLLCCGLALFLVYRHDPPTDPSILRALDWRAGEPGDYDKALPLWILTEIPEGWKGLFFAVLFGAGLSGLQGALLASPGSAAESSGLSKPGRSRFLIATSWSLALLVVSIGLARYASGYGEGLLSLAYGLATYTLGPIVGLSLLAARGADGVRPGGALAGVILSFILALMARPEMGWLLPEGSASFSSPGIPGLFERGVGEGQFGTKLNHAWIWPLTAMVTWVSGWKKRRTHPQDL